MTPRARQLTAEAKLSNLWMLLLAVLFAVFAFRMMLALQFLVGPINFPGMHPGIEANPGAAALLYGVLAAACAVAFDRLRARRAS